MTASQNKTIITDCTANPAPLGLMGFGMTTILLSLHNAGLVPLGAAIFAMGIFFGGLAQLIAGLMEWKKGNTFGMTVFSSFGFFWIIVVTILLAPTIGLTPVAESPVAMAWLFLLWGFFAAYLTIGTIRTNRVTQAIFVALTVVLLLLAAAEALVSVDMAAVAGSVKTVAGYLGILAGALAVYAAMGGVLNETLGRSVVPMFPVAKAVAQPSAEASSTE